MAKIQIRLSCAKDIFHEGKERNERKITKIHMYDKDLRIDTCNVQEIHRCYYTWYKDRGMHEGTRSNNVTRDETNAAKYSKDKDCIQRTPWTRRAVKRKKRRDE